MLNIILGVVMVSLAVLGLVVSSEDLSSGKYFTGVVWFAIAFYFVVMAFAFFLHDHSMERAAQIIGVTAMLLAAVRFCIWAFGSLKKYEKHEQHEE